MSKSLQGWFFRFIRSWRWSGTAPWLPVWRANAAEPVYDRLVTISLPHIMQIEPIVRASAS